MKDIQRELDEQSTEQRKLLPPFAEIMEMQGELATVLKEIRESKGISLYKMTELTGLSKKTIWRFEKGETIKLENFLKIIFVLGYEFELIEIGREVM